MCGLASLWPFHNMQECEAVMKYSPLGFIGLLLTAWSVSVYLCFYFQIIKLNPQGIIDFCLTHSICLL